MKTRMIFRRFPEGDVIALMPDEKVERGPKMLIDSYQHIGQHGGASRDLINELDHATEDEIEELSAELKQIGYNVLVDGGENE